MLVLKTDLNWAECFSSLDPFVFSKIALKILHACREQTELQL